jgi:hypothetical protein
MIWFPFSRLCGPRPESPLPHSVGHKFFGGFPELTVDEIGGKAAHERELPGLSGMDFERALLKRGKGELHQLVGSDQGDAVVLRKVCRHIGP